MKITLKVEREFDARFLKVEAGVRYWEDARVNGVDDEGGILIPCRKDDKWCPFISIENGQIVNWEKGKEANIHYKVCDDGRYTLLDKNYEEIKSIEDYVISDLTDDSDYIILVVDENGYIENWNPTLKDFQKEVDKYPERTN